MATNEIFRDADHLGLPVPAGTKAGGPVRIGGLIGLNGVAQTNRANTAVAPYNSDGTPNTDYDFGGGNADGEATVWLKGAATFTVAFAIATVGLPVYIVLADNTLSATDNSAANPLFGHALTTKAAPSGPLTVRIAN